ncbi:MAG: peptidoglycan DD-metalloendopeptidase family protein [Bacteroidota bacterium]|nr:peptidoglycan DD-metalloendopeptidase family protein [Rhodothermia bacterium]MCS7155044.1 peptidoglycan DD-metalloendopeptidase family protein [Bacteroidota bacterium]MDW8137945.1 peptidoglycan DD-metalloendopeptidase family protein [Bacteroidota bacterium]MDW8286203.1 peptidoglycan DD-metalloendopeptidase family protein [Bacteroidota bacterium]
MGRRLFVYDEGACAFVEARPSWGRRYGVLLFVFFSGVALSLLGLWLLSPVLGTPAETALRAENEALRQEVERTQHRIQALQARLERLVRRDEELYRLLLGARPLDPAERQVAVGGADAYRSLEGFSTPAAAALERLVEQLDRLERQIQLQQASFGELDRLLREREKLLSALPAILPVQGRLISGFGQRLHPILRIVRDHEGVDFIAPPGTPVYATGDGVIQKLESGGGYGNHIVIEHGFGYTSLYGHLRAFAPGMRPGRKVKRGEVIGYIGNTGLSTGPHLHYEVRRFGRPLNPLHFFVADLTPAQYQALRQAAERSRVSLD